MVDELMRSGRMLFGPFVVCAGLTLAAGCSQSAAIQTVSTADSGQEETRYAEAQGILTTKCTQCHGAARSEAKLRLDSWPHILRGSEYGEAVIAFDPDNSVLIEMVEKLEGGHPADAEADRLTAAELAVLREWIADGARNGDGSVPFADSDNLVYACNQGEAIISVIDSERNLVIRNIDLQKLGFSKTAKPHHVAVEPDGSHWYVSLIGENTVLKFNRGNELVARAQFEVPGMLVLDADRGLLYVGRSMSAVNPPKSIGVVTTADMSVDEVEVFVPRPHALNVGRSGRHVYAASLAQNTIVTVDTESLQPSLTDLGGSVQTLVQFAISPDGKLIGAGGQLSGRFSLFAIGDDGSLTLSDTLAVDAEPWHPVFTPDGRFLYVPNKGSNSVKIIDVANRKIIRTITGSGLSQPHGSAVSPDGRYVYVSNNNMKGAYHPRRMFGDNHMAGTVVVIDTRTGDIVKVLEVENGTTGLGARPASG